MFYLVAILLQIHFFVVQSTPPVVDLVEIKLHWSDDNKTMFMLDNLLEETTYYGQKIDIEIEDINEAIKNIPVGKFYQSLQLVDPNIPPYLDSNVTTIVFNLDTNKLKELLETRGLGYVGYSAFVPFLEAFGVDINSFLSALNLNEDVRELILSGSYTEQNASRFLGKDVKVQDLNGNLNTSELLNKSRNALFQAMTDKTISSEAVLKWLKFLDLSYKDFNITEIDVLDQEIANLTFIGTYISTSEILTVNPKIYKKFSNISKNFGKYLGFTAHRVNESCAGSLDLSEMKHYTGNVTMFKTNNLHIAQNNLFRYQVKNTSNVCYYLKWTTNNLTWVAEDAMFDTRNNIIKVRNTLGEYDGLHYGSPLICDEHFVGVAFNTTQEYIYFYPIYDMDKDLLGLFKSVFCKLSRVC